MKTIHKLIIGLVIIIIIVSLCSCEKNDPQPQTKSIQQTGTIIINYAHNMTSTCMSINEFYLFNSNGSLQICFPYDYRFNDTITIQNNVQFNHNSIKQPFTVKGSISILTDSTIMLNYIQLIPSGSITPICNVAQIMYKK